MGKKKGKGRGQARHETAAGEQASTAPTQQQQAAAAPRQQLQQAAGATVGQTSAVQSAPPSKWKPAGQTQEHNLAKHMDTMKIRQVGTIHTYRRSTSLSQLCVGLYISGRKQFVGWISGSM